jgi:hypothetical protein
MSEIFAYADSAKNAPVGRDDRPLPWKTVDGITTRANLTIEAGYPVPQSTNDAMTQAHLLGAIEPSEPCGAIDLLYVVVGALTVKERYVVCKPDELSEWEKRLPPFLVRKYRAEAIDPIIAGYHALGGNVSIRRYYTTTPTLTVTLDVTYQVYKF